MIKLKSVEVYRPTKQNGLELEKEVKINILFKPEDFRKACKTVGGHYSRLYPGREIRLIMRDEAIDNSELKIESNE